MKPFKWTIEITIDPSWVEDGFNMDDERAKFMVSYTLPLAYGHEYDAKVIRRPSAKRIRKIQTEGR